MAYRGLREEMGARTFSCYRLRWRQVQPDVAHVAWLAAEIASLIDRSLFLPVLTASYWATNIVGLLLLHMGAKGTAAGAIGRMSRPALLRWFGFSVLYTLVIVLCYVAGLIRPAAQYVRGPTPQ